MSGLKVKFDCSSDGENYKPVFSIKLKCSNCGNEWWVDCYEYDEVYEDFIFGVRVYNHKTKETRYIRCPVCKLEKTVHVVYRKVI